MRVCYVGNFLPPASTENEVRRAFEHLGWQVDAVQESHFTKAMARGAGRKTAVHERALEADLVLHTMTQGSYPHPRRVLELWNMCERKGIPTASIHLDLFYGLSSPKDSGPQRCELPAVHPMFRVAHVFTADGGHDAEWERDGVNHHWLPPGVSHTECIDVRSADDYPDVVEYPLAPETLHRILDGQYLVGFAGSDGYHPEWQHRPQLVNWLRRTYKDRFLHIGGSSTPRITGLALNRVLASVPVWVGDSCGTRPDFRYFSDRWPESWGRGGFLIHPRINWLRETYGPCPGDGWVAGDWLALQAAVGYWLDHRLEREATRVRIAAHVRAYDTYVQRVQTMLATIGLTEGGEHANASTSAASD